jgi:hypothetical protein
MLTNEERVELKKAKDLLESTSIAMKVADKLGKPIEWAMEQLPEKGKDLILQGTQKALEGCYWATAKTISPTTQGALTQDFIHRAFSWGSGFVGGFFGLSAIVAELPLTTSIMMRSIMEHARAQGFDLSDPKVQLDCLQVFGLAGRTAHGTDTAEKRRESSYFALRIAMAREFEAALAYIAQKGFAEEGAPVVLKFILSVAQRFGLAVGEKVTLQSVPVLGGVAGAIVNEVFITHYQKVANGHFIIRRLEKTHGSDLIQKEYTKL